MNFENVAICKLQWLLLNFSEWLCRSTCIYYYGGVTFILIGYRSEMRAWIFECEKFVYTLFGWIEIYLVDACWLNSKQIEWNDLTIPGWWFTTHYPKIKIKLIGSSLSNVIQWIKLLAVWWLSNRNQFNWCRWQCGRHLTDAWNCFIVSGSWFGIQKSLNIIKQPQTTHTHTLRAIYKFTWVWCTANDWQSNSHN